MAGAALRAFRRRVKPTVLHVDARLTRKVIPDPATARAIRRDMLLSAGDRVGVRGDTEQLRVRGDRLRAVARLVLACVARELRHTREMTTVGDKGLGSEPGSLRYLNLIGQIIMAEAEEAEAADNG